MNGGLPSASPSGWSDDACFCGGVGLSSVKPFCKHPHRLNPKNVHEDNHHARSTKVKILGRWRKMDSVWSRGSCHFYILMDQGHPGLRGTGSPNFSLQPLLPRQLRTATSSTPRGCWRIDRLLDHISSCSLRKQELGCVPRGVSGNPLPSPRGPLGDFLRNTEFLLSLQFCVSCTLLPP